MSRRQCGASRGMGCLLALVIWFGCVCVCVCA
eukprot:COSAG06_NODE_894_length_11709_cov_6.062010_1_plen_31_part_10